MSRWHKSPVNRRRWKPVRIEVLDRANWSCASCGGYANEVDHRTPVHLGGDPLDRKNLQALCRSCHIAKTKTENPLVDPERDRWKAFLRDEAGKLSTISFCKTS